jgi:hypothetical protein
LLWSAPSLVEADVLRHTYGIPKVCELLKESEAYRYYC